MNGKMNAPKGICKGTASLLIPIPHHVIEMGGADDARMGVLKALHHCNRQATDTSDFIAVAFPASKLGRNCMMPGERLFLLGSIDSLQTLVNSERMVTLQRRGLLEPLEPYPIEIASGMAGTAYIRDRQCERNTPGRLRRQAARRVRRGHEETTGQPPAHTEANPFANVLTLDYGNGRILHVRAVEGSTDNTPLLVSTYGLSSPSEPAILPVKAEHG